MKVIRLPNDNPTLQEATAALMAICPCPVEVKIPDHEPHPQDRSSCYSPKAKGRWWRAQDWIYLNEGGTPHRPVKSWTVLYILAHEIGHALDHHKIHPAQPYLKGRRCRYRNELAAVSFAHATMRHMRKQHLKTVQRWMVRDFNYVHRYVNSGGILFDLDFMSEAAQKALQPLC